MKHTIRTISLLFLLSIVLLGLSINIHSVNATGEAIKRVQGNAKGTSNNLATISVTMASTPTSGNVEVAVIDTDCSTTYRYVTSITQTGVTWTYQIRNTKLSGGTRIVVEIWFGVVSAGASTSVTVNIGTPNQGFAVADICEYSGVATSNFLDKIATNDGLSQYPHTGTTVTTTQANELWIGATDTIESYAQTTPTNGFTLLDGAGSCPAYLEKIVTATGTAYSSTTTSGLVNWCGCIATFKASIHQTLDSYPEANRDSYSPIDNNHPSSTARYSAVSQSFTTPTRATTLKSAIFYLMKIGSPTGNLKVGISSHSGTYGTSSVPATTLATSDAIASPSISTSWTLYTFTFTGAEQITLSASTYYCVWIYGDTAIFEGTNYIQVGIDSSSPTHSGNFASFRNNAWTAFSGQDTIFYVCGDVIPNWYHTETWSGNIIGKSFLYVEKWSGNIIGKNFFYSESWNGIFQTPVWFLVEAWNGLLTVKQFLFVEAWSGALEVSIRIWAFVETWQGVIDTFIFRHVETWEGMFTPTIWNFVEHWSGTITALQWYLTEHWSGLLPVKGFIFVEQWLGTIHALGWSLSEMWISLPSYLSVTSYINVMGIVGFILLFTSLPVIAIGGRKGLSLKHSESNPHRAILIIGLIMLLIALLVLFIFSLMTYQTWI